MPHLIGVELHEDGIAAAALRPDQTIALRPLDDIARIVARTCAQPWKWSLGVDGRDADAVVAATELFTALRYAMGDEHILAAVAVPSGWSDAARRSLLGVLEAAGVEVVQLVRESTALAVGALLLEPAVEGFCAVVDVGPHAVEVAVADVRLGAVEVLVRASIIDPSACAGDPAALLAQVEELGLELTRRAGLAVVEVGRVFARGALLADPAWAERVRAIWEVAPTVLPRGVAALGTAHVAVGLSGMYRPWSLRDDLLEPPLSALRGRAPVRLGVSVAPPPPAEEISIPAEFALYDAAAPPDPLAAAAEAISVPEAFEHLDAVDAPPGVRPTEAPAAAPEVSFDDAARVSEIPSYAPRTGHVGAIPAGGAFVGLGTLTAVRALSLVEPADEVALAAPSLPTLLNQFVFLRDASGVLVLRRHGERDLSLAVERGGLCVTAAERARAVQAFEWPDGLFSWHRQAHPWDVQRLRVPITAVVAAGLHAHLRRFETRDFARLHAARLPLSPVVPEARRARLARLALSEAEMRAVGHILDGTRSLETLLGEGFLGRGTLHQLVALLDVYGILHWVKPTAPAGGDPVQAMRRHLREIQGVNYFVVLGVHWSAPVEEIRAAWERLAARYAPGGPMERHDPELASRILMRGEAAWEVLCDPVTRAMHRRASYPDIDEELLATLLEDRAKALSMRGDRDSAVAMMELRGEFHVPEPRPEAARNRR